MAIKYAVIVALLTATLVAAGCAGSQGSTSDTAKDPVIGTWKFRDPYYQSPNSSYAFVENFSSVRYTFYPNGSLVITTDYMDSSGMTWERVSPGKYKIFVNGMNTNTYDLEGNNMTSELPATGIVMKQVLVPA